MRRISALACALACSFVLLVGPLWSAESDNRMLLNPDAGESYFRRLLHSRNLSDWKALLDFSFAHPARYAELMRKYNAWQADPDHADTVQRNPSAGFARWFRRQVQTSGDVAQKSAVLWRDGFGLSAKEMLPKLQWRGFPSTRRIAFEFLRQEAGGKTFGFDWRLEPGDPKNDEPLRQWRSWVEAPAAQR